MVAVCGFPRQLMGLKTELATEREAHSAEKLSLRDEADHER